MTAYYPVYTFNVCNEILKREFNADLTESVRDGGYSESDVAQHVWPLPELAVEVDEPEVMPNAEASVAAFIGFPPRLFSETMPLFIRQDIEGQIRVYVKAELYDDTF